MKLVKRNKNKSIFFSRIKKKKIISFLKKRMFHVSEIG